jgi:long-chain acyl-CoA synthetase
MIPILSGIPVESQRFVYSDRFRHVYYFFTMNLYTAFKGVVSRHGGEISVRGRERSLSYDEVHAGALRMGVALAGRGLEPGRVAAVLLPNSPAFVQVFFGIQAAGGTVLPLNGLLRPEDLVFQLRHSEATVLVSSSALGDALSGIRNALPDLDVCTVEEILGQPEPTGALPGDLPAPDAPAVLLYTSGTTADPKGVLLSHRNLYSNYQSYQGRFSFHVGDCFVGVLPFFHSFGLTTVLLATQLTGATMEPLPAFQPQETVETVDRAVRDGLRTVFPGVPAMFELMARVPGEWRINETYILISGGAALPQAVFERFRERYGAEVLQGYGLTEASPVVACNAPGMHRPGTIGPVLPGIEVEVRDEKDHLLPQETEGELLVRGENVMLGYLGNQRATREVLTDDGWLRTGDMAKISSDGFISICGRRKDLIISAGENIHPQEIEAILSGHPKIVEAAVIGTPDRVKGEIPKAFVVPVEGETVQKSELRRFCLDRLPEFKVPREFVMMESLPKTPMGKVAKRHLPRE